MSTYVYVGYWWDTGQVRLMSSKYIDGVASGAHMRDSEIFIFYGCRELNLIDKIFVWLYVFDMLGSCMGHVMFMYDSCIDHVRFMQGWLEVMVN